MTCDCENTERVDSLHKAVFGNGKIEQSILFRIAVMEKMVKTIRTLTWVILAAIVGIGVRGAATWVHIDPPQKNEHVSSMATALTVAAQHAREAQP